MSALQRWSPWKEEPRRTAVILGSLLLTLALGTRAHAVTAVSIDGHSNPVSLVEGETDMVRFDIAKPGGSDKGTLARDLTGTGKFDATAPIADNLGVGGTDGGSSDLDPAPGKIAVPFLVDAGQPAGPYFLHLADPSDGSALDLPLTIVPKSEPQAISGRVAVVTTTNPAGSPPPDAIIWAFSDPQTPV